ncbi:hypothetical protein JCM11641_005096 [Rhodosporidiobolus odoratus]
MPRTSASSSRTARSSPLSSPTSSEPEDERFQPRANSKAARQADGAPQDALADLTRKLARDPALAEDLWRVLQNLRTEQADGEAEEKRKKVRQGKRRAVETHDESSDEMGQEEHPLISRDRRQRAADEESLIGLEEPSTRKKSRTTVSGQGNAGSSISAFSSTIRPLKLRIYQVLGALLCQRMPRIALRPSSFANILPSSNPIFLLPMLRRHHLLCRTLQPHLYYHTCPGPRLISTSAFPKHSTQTAYPLTARISTSPYDSFILPLRPRVGKACTIMRAYKDRTKDHAAVRLGFLQAAPHRAAKLGSCRIVRGGGASGIGAVLSTSHLSSRTSRLFRSGVTRLLLALTMPTFPPPTAPYGRRMQAIETPCPRCIPLSAKGASMVATFLSSCIYLAWSIILWKGYFQLSELKGFSSGSATGELSMMARYSAFTAWFASTMTLVCFSSFVASVFPQKDFAKWLSRTIWVGWLVSWALGIFGLVAYVSSDAFLAAGCKRGAECWTIRQQLQIWLIIGLFITLFFVFWFNVVLSAFVHTLHPHIFRSADSDTEDDYSDDEEAEAAREAAIDDELRRSRDPLAYDVLAERLLKRLKTEALIADLRQGRAGSRRRHGWVEEEEDPQRPASLLLSEGKLNSSRRTAQPTYSDESSSDMDSDEYEEEQLMLRTKASRANTLKPRRLSAIVSGDDWEDEQERPPSHHSRDRRATQLKGDGVPAERSLGRSRSRSKSRSRSRGRQQ